MQAPSLSSLLIAFSVLASAHVAALPAAGATPPNGDQARAQRFEDIPFVDDEVRVAQRDQETSVENELRPIIDIDPLLSTAVESTTTIRPDASPLSTLSQIDPMFNERQRIAAPGPHAHFDVTAPVDVETIDADSHARLAQTSVPPIGMDNDSLLYGGYDGMVDSYVAGLLHSGRATPERLPGSSSLLDGPNGFANNVGAGYQAPAGGWYAQAGVLWLEPWGEKDLETSFDSATGNTALTTHDVDLSWSRGFDARVGIRTGYSAVEFGWWSLFSATSEATALSPTGDLFSIINFIELDVDLSNAMLHELRYELETHSFDLSQQHLLSDWNTGRLRFAWMWGARFIRISDALDFFADKENTTLGDATGETRYQLEVDNRLIGPQIGGTANWEASDALTLSIDGRGGVFYNYIDHAQSASDTTGTSQIISGPDAGRLFNIDRSQEQAAVMAELQLTAQYLVGQHVRLMAGYRAFAVSGVALSRAQVPWRFGSLSASGIDASEAILLHGFQLGLDVSF